MLVEKSKVISDRCSFSADEWLCSGKQCLYRGDLESGAEALTFMNENINETGYRPAIWNIIN